MQNGFIASRDLAIAEARELFENDHRAMARAERWPGDNDYASIRSLKISAV
jgi:hypothetical protein